MVLIKANRIMRNTIDTFALIDIGARYTQLIEFVKLNAVSYNVMTFLNYYFVMPGQTRTPLGVPCIGTRENVTVVRSI